MNTIDKIRAEIERLEEIYYPNALESPFEQGVLEGLGMLKDFLDTLEEKHLADASKPFNEDFDSEIKKFFDEYIVVYEVPLYGKVKECVIEASDYEMIAYHFYQLGLNAKPK